MQIYTVCYVLTQNYKCFDHELIIISNNSILGIEFNVI